MGMSCVNQGDGGCVGTCHALTLMSPLVMCRDGSQVITASEDTTIMLFPITTLPTT
jgi:hypothetical protein